MKKLALFLLAAGTVCFMSCGKKDVAKIVLNEDLSYVVSVYGEESDSDDDFFEPVAGVYPVKKKDGKLEVTMEFVKIKKTSNTKYSIEEFILTPDDGDHKLKINDKKVEFQAEDRHAAAQQLFQASVGDKVKVTFTYVISDEKATDEMVKMIKECEVELTLDELEESSEDITIIVDDDDEDIDEDDEGNIGSEDWDKVLDEYEKYVNSYVSLYKKAMNGDMSAMGEYASMLEKAQSFSDKLEKAGSNLTATQIARMNKINNKMLTAIN